LAWKERLKSFGRRFLENLAADVGLQIIRGYLVERLSSLTPQQLYDAIQRWDTDLWAHTNQEDKLRGQQWAHKYRRFQNHVTGENVYEWLRWDRPDLASCILNTPKGLEWLEKVVANVKVNLWPPVEIVTEKT